MMACSMALQAQEADTTSADGEHAKAENALRYIETKFFHFLVGIRKTSQNGAKGVYRFVPLQDFTRAWTDAGLYARYGLTAEESAFIEQTIPDASAARPSRERRP